jgi:hypothetical protein
LSAIRSSAFLDVKFTDLVRDPIGVVRELYRELGDNLSPNAERRMGLFLSEHPNEQYGSHSYAIASFGIDPAEVDQRFHSYRERFGLGVASKDS